MSRTRRVVPALLATVAALALPAGASAADFTVNNQGDTGTGGCTAQECTLREAITAAATAADRVVLPAGNYAVSAGAIALGGDTIVGAGARTTIIDAGNSAIFTVTAATNQVSGVTLTGGDGLHTLQGPRIGGAIDVSGQFAPSSLTLTDSALDQGSLAM